MKGLSPAVKIVGLALAVVIIGGCIGRDKKIDELMGHNIELANERDRLINERDGLKADNKGLRNQLIKGDSNVAVADNNAKLWEEKFNLAQSQLEKAYEQMEKMPVAPGIEEILKIARDMGLPVHPETGAIELSSDILFDSGKATLKKGVSEKLKELARAIAEREELDVAVEGHTDTDPIKKSPWKDNWQLSTERARAVLVFLEKEGVAPGRMHIAGYSMYKPIVDTTTTAGKAKNRRVELHLVPAAKPK